MGQYFKDWEFLLMVCGREKLCRAERAFVLTAFSVGSFFKTEKVK